MKKRMLISNFNPRSHERSDKSERRINHGTINFNPRSHERSDRMHRSPKRIRKRFQSTLPREERRFQAENGQWYTQISIHAPTRGATLHETHHRARNFISIHAPTRGATAILHKKFVYFYTIPTINI